MPDDALPPADLNAKVTAFLKKCEDAGVKQLGIERAYLRDTLKEKYRDRIVVGERGPVRVLRPGTLEFYPTGMDLEDQIAPVLNELAQGTPDEHRLEAVKEREKNVAAMTEEKRNNPRNWVL